MRYLSQAEASDIFAFSVLLIIIIHFLYFLFMCMIIALRDLHFILYIQVIVSDTQ